MAFVPALPQFDFLAGGGEMGARTRALDWTRTPLGSPATWPQSLKTIIRMVLHSRYAMWMFWGPEFTFFCNDAYLPTLGMKGKWALGARSDKVWEEIWPDLLPRIKQVLERGEATWDEGLLLFLERNGFLEETYHTFSYSPIHNDDSTIAGMLCVVTEVTDRVIGERRLRTLRDLAARSAGTENVGQVFRRQEAVLRKNLNDLQFSALYLLDDAQEGGELGWHTGNAPMDMLPERSNLSDLSARWPIAQLQQQGRAVLLKNFTAPSGKVSAALWSEPIRQVLVLPVRGSGVAPLIGFLIVGLSPRLKFEEEYRDFLGLIASQVAAALADARAYEAERKRAEALQEIDRTKTAFFSNVSHEFRTPLTLILGPLADTLNEGDLPSLAKDRIELAHRNSLRLLRLVNSLLDFSRIEAGRAQATYESTDLAALTRDLASLFRSTIERAGLRFEVSCDPLPKSVYVDREMWEKIVLNLLSNAFKFTVAGSIRVELTSTPDFAVLAVTDTGVGIPATEVPRLFERFHRVETTQGRTHEGSGIGLALVLELVKLHGGEIRATSVLGAGSTFTVELPYGVRHVPAERVRAQPLPPLAPAATAQAFVQEALRWLPDTADRLPAQEIAEEQSSKLDRRFAATFGARIILAEDNADMRAYVRDLLAPLYEVEAVSDGAEALSAVRRQRPALILSDIMMPNLDGFGLLSAVRADTIIHDIPIILLSARAGEGSRVEGLDAGADDYLVKPFSGRELLARVGALIELTQLRQAGEERLRLAIEGARMGTWDWDLQRDVVHWSVSHFETLGYVPNRDGVASYQMWRACWHPEDAPRIESELQQALASLSRYHSEYRIRRADTGETRWLSVYGRMLGEQGTATRNIGIFLDITDRKLAENALLDADRHKDEFLATLAHELRNPLGPIRNAARILGTANLAPEKLAWCREVIQRQTEHMALLLDDLLDVSRITLGRLQLKKESVPIASIVEAAVEMVRPLLASRNHSLAVTLPQSPVLLEVDPLRIAQVLGNLLTNAAKYTEPGGQITVEARALQQSVEIVVSDTGIGLEPASIERIFAMFSQVDSVIDRSEGGLGIGLALVRGLVELHGGSVWAHSEGLGRGSRFVFQLPGVTRRVSASVKPMHPLSPSAKGWRIVIADDNRDAATSLAMLLEIAGHEVRLANDGAEALALIESFQPQAAFIDIGMPLLNGYEVARRVRRQAWGADMRLIAVSGWGQDHNKRQAHQAGFDHHLTKPFEPSQPELLLQQLFGAPDTADAPARRS